MSVHVADRIIVGAALIPTLPRTRDSRCTISLRSGWADPYVPSDEVW
jgi:hypothetical protein